MEGLTEPGESDREECWTVKVAYLREKHSSSLPLSLRTARTLTSPLRASQPVMMYI